MKIRPQVLAGIILLTLIAGISLFLDNNDIALLATGGIVASVGNLTEKE